MGLLNKKELNYANEFKELFSEEKGRVNIDLLIKCINEWELNVSGFEHDANYQLAKSMTCGLFVMVKLNLGENITNLTKPLQSTLDSLKRADSCPPKDQSLYEWYQVQSNIIEGQLLDACQ